MKAVIWTDVIQTLLTYVTIILSIIFGIKTVTIIKILRNFHIMLLGFINAGGVRKVFEVAMAGNRIQYAKYIENILEEDNL